MTTYKLIIFDLDGTLADRDSDVMYPDAVKWMNQHKDDHWFAIATNQGGVGLRHWMETEGFGNPEEFPTQDAVENRLFNLLQRGHLERGVVLSAYVCYAYQSKKSGLWSPVPADADDPGRWLPENRKPAPGMLIVAMQDQEVAPGETLMVGDSEEDRLAAEAAGCAFQWADDFFGRS